MGERIKKYVFCDYCNTDKDERDNLDGWLPTTITEAVTYHGWRIDEGFALRCVKCDKGIIEKRRNKDDKN